MMSREPCDEIRHLAGRYRLLAHLLLAEAAIADAGTDAPSDIEFDIESDVSNSIGDQLSRLLPYVFEHGMRRKSAIACLEAICERLGTTVLDLYHRSLL